MLDTKDTKEKEPLPVRRGRGPEAARPLQQGAGGRGRGRAESRQRTVTLDTSPGGGVACVRQTAAGRAGKGGDAAARPWRVPGGRARWGAGAGGGRWVESRLSGQVRSGGAQVPEAEGPSQGVRMLHQRRSDDRRYAEE